jgi:hypothetical protein
VGRRSGESDRRMQTTETRWLARQCCRGVQGKSRRFVSEEGRVDVVTGTQIKHTIAALVGPSSKYLPCLQTKHVALVSASSKYLLYRMQKKKSALPSNRCHELSVRAVALPPTCRSLPAADV